MSSINYRRKFRELNFQKRAQAYHATEAFMKKLPVVPYGGGIFTYNFTYPKEGISISSPTVFILFYRPYHILGVMRYSFVRTNLIKRSRHTNKS